MSSQKWEIVKMHSHNSPVINVKLKYLVCQVVYRISHEYGFLVATDESKLKDQCKPANNQKAKNGYSRSKKWLEGMIFVMQSMENNKFGHWLIYTQ